MIGPVACFTCGKRLGAYWETYYKLNNKYKIIFKMTPLFP